MNRAPLSELNDTRRETERVLSDFRYVIAEWAPRIDEVRVRQETKLDITLKKFEKDAIKSAQDAISLRIQSLTMVGTTQPTCMACF